MNGRECVMSKSFQQNLGPMEVKRLHVDQSPDVQKEHVAEITLDMAKTQIGRALQKTIFRTNSVLKDFGHPGLVKRVCEGEVPSVLARAWQRTDRRREFLRALAEEESVKVRTIYEFEERKTA